VKKLSRRQQLFALSPGRASLAADLGQTAYGGGRDYYLVFGYPKTISMATYSQRYQRQDIAGRIVDLPAQDTWRKPPMVSEDGNEDTAFVQAWNTLATRHRVWSKLMRVDRLSGIGRYGVLLLGVKGQPDLGRAVEARSAQGVSSLLYLNPLSEAGASISTWNTDANSPRFGMPETYRVQLGESSGTRTVHWSRLIHVAEGKLDSETYGLPRLQRVFNRLDDLMKIVGGSAEATWLNMRPGTLLTPREGYELPDDAAAKAARQEEVDEYLHDVARLLFLEGVDATQLPGEVVDPTGLFDVTIKLIAAATGIPQRRLLGSAAGQLAAAKEDSRQWFGSIASRQVNYAEPEILRPFIDRLVLIGILPLPDSGNYNVGVLGEDGTWSWPSLFELTDLEQADIKDKTAGAIRKLSDPLTGAMPVTDDEAREALGYAPREEENMTGLIVHDGFSDYGLGLRAAVRGLWSGKIEYFDFVDFMTATVQRNLRRAWIEGARKVGIKEDELTQSELTRIEGITANEMQHIIPFGNDIEAKARPDFKLGPHLQRTLKWQARYTQVMHEAMLTAREDFKARWDIHSQEPCTSCSKLNGKVKRISMWNAAGIRPQGPNLQCMIDAGGVTVCKCTLTQTDEPLTRGKLPSMP